MGKGCLAIHWIRLLHRLRLLRRKVCPLSLMRLPTLMEQEEGVDQWARHPFRCRSRCFPVAERGSDERAADIVVWKMAWVWRTGVRMAGEAEKGGGEESDC